MHRHTQLSASHTEFGHAFKESCTFICVDVRENTKTMDAIPVFVTDHNLTDSYDRSGYVYFIFVA